MALPALGAGTRTCTTARTSDARRPFDGADNPMCTSDCGQLQQAGAAGGSGRTAATGRRRGAASPPPPAPTSEPAPAPAPAAVLTEEELFARKTLDELNAERALGDALFDFDQSIIRAEARPIL